MRSDEGTISHVKSTQRRKDFESDRLLEMREVIDRSGSRLLECKSDQNSILSAIADIKPNAVISNIQISDNIEFQRDRLVWKELKSQGIECHELCTDGIGRGSQSAPAPYLTSAKNIPWFKFKKAPWSIGELRSFLERLPRSRYREDMWIPGKDEKATSLLSTAIACGSLSVDRILHETSEAMSRSENQGTSWQQFAARPQWRRSFVQMFEKNINNFPWGPHREERKEDQAYMNAWLNGETGYPLVDAVMRQLSQQGWANFRMRQVACSFGIDLLDLDPYRAGVALGELFNDYTPGIHWMQIARQSGMMVGVGPRVVNPIKQAKDLDPKGDYVKAWIPELRDVPVPAIFEPWKYEGYKGPAPIIDYKEAARKARELRTPPSKNKSSEKKAKSDQLSLL